MNQSQQWEFISEVRSLGYIGYEEFKLLKKIGKLSKQHHRLCEDSCNGVETQFLYGHNFDIFLAAVPFLDSSTIPTDQLIEKIEARIKHIVDEVGEHGLLLDLEFQHDPRGLTVKLYSKGLRNVKLYHVLH